VSDNAKPVGGFSLRRWSARKRAAVGQATTERAAEAPAAGPAVDAGASPPASAGTARPASSAPANRADATVAASGVAMPPANQAAANVALPPIESLTPQSDFTPFMRPDVEPSLRRAALRKLFADPHFNVMDGLDTYIDDYSKPDPISPDMVKMLTQARYIFAPPPTRVNAQGFVEDVPEEELAALAQAQAQATPAIAPAEAGAPVVPETARVETDTVAASEPDDAPRQRPLPLDVPPDVQS
jgi:Protein of unknown function (DUF3306)